MLKATISNEIIIHEPSQEILDWANKNLVFPNPEYAKKLRMHFWLGNTPKNFYLYRRDGDDLIIPYGYKDKIKDFTTNIEERFSQHEKIHYLYFVPLRGYQADAVRGLKQVGYGILKSCAGSGKTQIGLALAMSYQTKTLWLTHTKELLKQSYDRAKGFCDESLLGTITEGKVNMGKAITFATVQTMCNLDLLRYRETFDVVIVDEVHNVATSSDSFTRFQKVLENLNAKHKFGLSATIHRADGLINTTFALVGGVSYVVPDELLESYTQRISVKSIPTYWNINLEGSYVKSDGTIEYTSLISALANDESRNAVILTELIRNDNEYNLILSARLEQLRYLKSFFSDDDSAIIDGSMTGRKKKEREQAIEDMRTGKKHYLFATFKLAKEGLDIPRLNRLYLATPEKDSAIIIQSIGRIKRKFEGKKESIVYDFVDDSRMFFGLYKKRVKIYQQEKCEVL